MIESAYAFFLIFVLLAASSAFAAPDKVVCKPIDACQYSKEKPPIPDTYVIKKTGNSCTKEQIVEWRDVMEQKDGTKVWMPTKTIMTIPCSPDLKPN
jgi:hypothetical protein